MNKAEPSWRKSSHSSNAGQCVEVATWRKSSYSSDAGQCMEVAAHGAVLVRDTTDRGGVTLSLPAQAWRVFIADIRPRA